MNKHMVFAAALFLMVGFQNCSNSASFDAAGSLIAKAGVDDSSGDAGGNTDVPPDVPADVPTEVVNNDGAVIPVPPPTTQPPTTGMQPPPVGTQPPAYPPVVGRDPGKDDDKECSNPGHRGDDKKKIRPTGLVACILEGPGSSVKVGLSHASLEGQHAVSHSVCMSEQACLTLVSKILPVKGVAKRGYCGRNPHVVSMTDADVEAAVNQELLAKMVSSL